LPGSERVILIGRIGYLKSTVQRIHCFVIESNLDLVLVLVLALAFTFTLYYSSSDKYQIYAYRP
jgi:hypothetical protein